MNEELAEDLRDYLYDEGFIDAQIEQDDEVTNIYLDLPNTGNYDTHIEAVESFFAQSVFDVEDFEIDGDYEGHIEITYEGE